MVTNLSENISFHSSPHSYITNRILNYYKNNPEKINQRRPIRAKLLHRNVVILSAYHDIRNVLEHQDRGDDETKYTSCAAAPAYRQLMDGFFPYPNLLLEDGCPHHTMKALWQGYTRPLQDEAIKQHIVGLSVQFLSSTEQNVPFNLYAFLKVLGWRLLVSVFLELYP